MFLFSVFSFSSRSITTFNISNCIKHWSIKSRLKNGLMLSFLSCAITREIDGAMLICETHLWYVLVRICQYMRMLEIGIGFCLHRTEILSALCSQQLRRCMYTKIDVSETWSWPNMELIGWSEARWFIRSTGKHFVLSMYVSTCACANNWNAVSCINPIGIITCMFVCHDNTYDKCVSHCVSTYNVKINSQNINPSDGNVSYSFKKLLSFRIYTVDSFIPLAAIVTMNSRCATFTGWANQGKGERGSDSERRLVPTSQVPYLPMSLTFPSPMKFKVEKI